MNDNREDASYVKRMYRSLVDGNVDRFMGLMRSFFAGIPYDISDRVRDREQYYQSMMYQD
jgi:hypothetical protein